MAEIDKIVGRLPAKSPRELLLLLAEEARKPGARPELVVYARSGVSFKGELLGFGADGRAETVLLACPEAGKPGILYLSMEEIAAVKVLDAARLAPVLSDGAVARAPGSPAPSRLELKRALAAVSERIKSACGLELEVAVEWAGAPDEADAGLNVLEIVDALAGAVKASSAGSMGRKAWGGLSRIRVGHKAGGSPEARRAGGALTLSVDLGRALPKPLVGALKDAFDAAL